MEEHFENIKDSREILFISFVSMLYNSGIQQLGKIMNPVTGKIHKDLVGVQSTIEILEMLREKTQGNLSNKEKSMLDSSISNLQLNYVEELESEEKKEKAAEPEKKSEQESKDEKE
ncbi:MAG: DUF1844 domain-containing protein [Candidatus Aureabacteria bacterium]|nr:DUF1844 domain-containing protein [Candidatus Auribacterota bacterium]